MSDAPQGSGVIGFVLLDRFIDGLDGWLDDVRLEMEMERQHQQRHP